MNLLIEVDTTNGQPPWRQVHDQLRGLITSSALAAGTRLPTVRQLARDLGVSAGTVARAYRELETTGMLSTAGRRGTVVAEITEEYTPAELTALARDFVAAARLIGVDRADALSAVTAAWQAGAD
ncbi:GntR family transcriptional regulator [Allokutzneria sp. A3M-2-11 16]|uniref:GntR family transcriptional regulator n=1 Tax=Allokutzneria sp. A3M-2-11 16 TaxID=2962043 RepID=UPI0027E365F6|nr:GntR family transcriptional regulator [Allokutzneria sp. A3M-2-11 16]